MKVRVPSLLMLIMMAVSCDNAPVYDLGNRSMAASGSEYWNPRCWDGRSVIDTPQRLEVLMAVRPAGESVYVSFLSLECDANLMQVEEFDKYPSIFRLEDTARLFVINSWPESDKAALAKKLESESIIYRMSHAVAITKNVEFYRVELEISGARFSWGQHEYLTVDIKNVADPEKLNVSGWTDDFR